MMEFYVEKDTALDGKRLSHRLRHRLISSLLAVILVFFAVTYIGFRKDYIVRVSYFAHSFFFMEPYLHDISEYKMIDTLHDATRPAYALYITINFYPKVTAEIKKELKEIFYDGPWILFKGTDRTEGTGFYG